MTERRRGGKKMIYIIEQQNSNPNIQPFIENYLKEYYPIIQFQSLKNSIDITNIQHNTYFIINDNNNPDDYLNLASKIRKNDQFGHIILITKNIDYQSLFRSHIAFFEIIDSDQQPELQIIDCINFLFHNTSNQAT